MQMLSSLEMFDENNLVALGKKRAGSFKSPLLNFESVNKNIVVLSYAAQETMDGLTLIEAVHIWPYFNRGTPRGSPSGHWVRPPSKAARASMGAVAALMLSPATKNN